MRPVDSDTTHDVTLTPTPQSVVFDLVDILVSYVVPVRITQGSQKDGYQFSLYWICQAPLCVHRGWPPATGRHQTLERFGISAYACYTARSGSSAGFKNQKKSYDDFEQWLLICDIPQDPLTNKGTSFPIGERDRLGIRGLLPPRIIDFETQQKKVTIRFEIHRSLRFHS